MRKPITEILDILREKIPHLQDAYHLDSLELFGSYVRSQENDNSDLDLLVTFSITPSLLKFLELENYLTDMLGVKVDLVMKNSLKSGISQNIVREARPIQSLK